MSGIIDRAKTLKKLGLEAIADRILRKQSGKKKLLQAIGQYKYVTQEDIDTFQEEMQKFNKRLAFSKIKDYKQLPPDKVLKSLEGALEKNCFDEFYVAYIEQVKDPILFGKINDFPTLYFYIAQWGDDVKIEDILKYE